MKDLYIVNIDYTGSNSTYRKEDLVDTSKLSGFWIVPEEAPFYTDSLRILNGGSFLTKGVDYEPVEPQPQLAELTGKGVSLYIELKDHMVTNHHNLVVIYQKVGSPVISRKTLLDLFDNMEVSGGVVDFNVNVVGIPDTVPPAQHSMDMSSPSEMIGFGGLVELFKHFSADEKGRYNAVEGLLDQTQTEIFTQLNLQHKARKDQLFAHIQHYLNPHDIKPVDVNLGKLTNAATAHPQQDLDGIRSDLYSTPYGLRRVIEETETDTDAWILQNELPISYYGSGIYLPPPIDSGVVESAVEHQNSVFVRESNGWIVGLVKRVYGGQRGLYYIYNDKVIDRYNKDKFKHTNFQYHHNTFSDLGLMPDSVMSGSGDEFIIAADSIAKKAFITYSHSSLDPKLHKFKELDLTPFQAVFNGADPVINNHFAKIGDYIYFFLNTADVAQETVDGNFIPGGVGKDDRSANWSTYIFRVPVNQVGNNLAKVTPVLVNTTYENIDRTLRTDQSRFCLFKHTRETPQSTNLISSIVNYDQPVANAYSDKRRTYFILENPNLKTQARVRILVPHFCNLGTGGRYNAIIVDYLFDTVTNTLTLDPNWVKPTLNVGSNTFPNLTEQQYKKEVALGSLESFCLNGSDMTNSWVPGFGPMTVTSSQGLRDRMKRLVDNAVNALWPESTIEPDLGENTAPPLTVVYLQSNPWGEHIRDYESLGLPANQYNEIDDLNSFSEILIVNKNPEGIPIPSYPWVVRVSADMEVVFNGISVKAKETLFNLAGISTVYRNSTFYLYCQLSGSIGVYEITKTLRFANGTQLLVAIIHTDDVGVSSIEKFSPLAIMGYPITRVRETGIPASEGLLSEVGEYKFLKQSELVS